MNEHEAATIIPELERGVHAVALWVEHVLGGLRLSQAEAHVLAHLARTSQCTINDLHRGFGHKRSTLSSLLDRLERRGLIARGRHPRSRRLVMVELTDAGREVAIQASAAMRALEGRVAARVGAGDIAAFLRVVAALEETIAERLTETIEEELSHE
jgi:DNA-binding MarR family transcriptional regulator